MPPIDLTKATIVIGDANSPEDLAVRILREEVEKRTGIAWKVYTDWPGGRNLIALATRGSAKLAGRAVPRRKGDDLPEVRKEGYRLHVQRRPHGHVIVWIVGADRRGTLFGAGHLLRLLSLSKGSAKLPHPVDIATAPAYSIRGHQLGYRDTANSYDAWTVEQYERYIRELAIFGANCIENIPLQDKTNVLMKLPRREMNKRISALCARYDVDYWVWTPADFDLSNVSLRQAAIEEHEQLCRDCRRLDGVFFPGGDPGNNHPRLVMPFLEELSTRLKAHHPKAGIWISLQGFNRESVEYFFDYLKEHDPDWLAGVVAGPSSPPIDMTRARLPKKYKLRSYPDITHTVRCQFPVQKWDQAFALTLGREPCNPRPNFYARIHNLYAPHTDGFLSYSDGVHDDVNKVVWTRRAWNPEEDVGQIILEYCRFFLGDDVAEDAAAGIFALERNWEGPLAANESVERTLDHWKSLEQRAPHLTGNWRWQLLLLRAYYDAYQRRRLIHERQLEREAMKALAKVDSLGIDGAMEQALKTVKRADVEPFCEDLRKRIEDLCEALFQSIGLQTSVPRYHASGSERGCVLDFLRYPLNNRWWLEDEFNKIRQMPSEEEKRARLEVIRTWEDPGPGSFYDDVGNIANSPHVDPLYNLGLGFAWWDGGYSRTRLSSQTYINRPKLRYENLDPKADYMIRVAGFGEALLEINGERIQPTLYNKTEGQFKEFPVSKRLLASGAIEVTFAKPDEDHLNWRHKSRVSDVWLLRV